MVEMSFCEGTMNNWIMSTSAVVLLVLMLAFCALDEFGSFWPTDTQTISTHPTLQKL
jgi:hypothetical protein